MSTPQLEPNDKKPMASAGKVLVWSFVAIIATSVLYGMSILVKLAVEVWIAISHL